MVDHWMWTKMNWINTHRLLLMVKSVTIAGKDVFGQISKWVRSSGQHLREDNRYPVSIIIMDLFFGRARRKLREEA